MANCPSAAAGARTSIAMTDDGYDLTVVAAAPEDAARILERARRQVEMAAPHPQARQHTGRHGGTGVGGYCPIVHDADAAITFTTLATGARIHVRVPARGSIYRVQREAAARVAALRSERRN